jgi:hypothetical protein
MSALRRYARGRADQVKGAVKLAMFALTGDWPEVLEKGEQAASELAGKVQDGEQRAKQVRALNGYKPPEER